MSRPNVLKTKTTIFEEVDYGDLEAFLDLEYEISHPGFQIMADNDSTHEILVEPTPEELRSYDRNEVYKIIKQKYATPLELRVIFLDLLYKGRIESGRYLINVSW